MAVIDLDHFKIINDQNGHVIGDEVLKSVAIALHDSATVRSYRLGGEEFIVFLCGSETECEAELRRQAITTIVAEKFPYLSGPVTASMGFVNLIGDESFAALYERADKLMYKAKNAGRNRSVTEKMLSF